MKSTFAKVFDSSGKRVKGLCRRNGFYYAQIYLYDKGKTVRVRLMSEDGTPARNLREAESQRNAMVKKQQHNRYFGAPAITPLFGQYAERYLEYSRSVKDPHTVSLETCALKRMVAFFGSNIRLAQLNRVRLNDFVKFRLSCGIRPSTLNTDVAILRRVLKHAQDEEVVGRNLATDSWKPLRCIKPERRLFTVEEIDKIVAEARTPGKYRWGAETADWVLLMAYSGARHRAALSVQWRDVDFVNKRLTLRRNQKLDKVVYVDFNEKLAAHLKDMFVRKQTYVKHLFPFGPEDHVQSLDSTLVMVREAVGIPDFLPHGLRHFFISWCVMSGVDFMTIARWVGHADGGVLIGKVYGHLNDEHQRRSASLVRFGIAKADDCLCTLPQQCPSPSEPSSP